jgi:hypothetical protein
VKSTITDPDGREDCILHELFPNRDPLWRVRVNGKRSYVTSTQGRTYRLEHTPTPITEFANSLTTVPGQWIETVTEHDHTDHALLHNTTIIHTKRGTIRGAVSKQLLQAYIRNMHDKFIQTAYGYQTESSMPPATPLCQVCDHPGANRTCANAPCPQTAHVACSQQDWTCGECTTPVPTPELPPTIAAALLASPLTYTASDGSVRNQDTPLSSSTYGFHISHNTHPFTHLGHIPSLTLRSVIP